MSAKTQCDEILGYMKHHTMITPVDALTRFGCFRLAARIYDLRNQGHTIDTLQVHNGDKTYAGYKLTNKELD